MICNWRQSRTGMGIRMWFRQMSLLRSAIILVFIGSGAFAQTLGLPGPNSSSSPQASSPNATAEVPPAVAVDAGIDDDNYHLGTGDKLKINVYGEEDLSGDFFVDGSGQVQLPLIGQVKAAGLSVHEFVDEVKRILGSKYLRDPKVSVQIENYRPFYIMGEVNKSGEYPYENGMNILGAVALAGGYTYRANDTDVYIRRNGSTKEEKLPANALTRVNPGDIVRVPERIF
jgi:protein involved in polysaccharide export with SLBB domain